MLLILPLKDPYARSGPVSQRHDPQQLVLAGKVASVVDHRLCSRVASRRASPIGQCPVDRRRGQMCMAATNALRGGPTRGLKESAYVWRPPCTAQCISQPVRRPSRAAHDDQTPGRPRASRGRIDHSRLENSGLAVETLGQAVLGESTDQLVLNAAPSCRATRPIGNSPHFLTQLVELRSNRWISGIGDQLTLDI